MTKILLVEDNEMNRDMLSRRLERRGYEVVIAVDGQQGVDLALSNRPDLILMDMSLPVIDGWEATRLLKKSTRTRSIPVVVMTAYQGENAHEMARDAGCAAVFVKPVLPDALEAELRRQIAGEPTQH